MLKQLIAEKPTPEEVQALLVEVALVRANKHRITDKLADLFADVERQEKRVAMVNVGMEDYGIIRRYCDTMADPITDKEEFNKGHFCDLWGAEFWLKKGLDGVEIMDGDGKVHEFK